MFKTGLTQGLVCERRSHFEGGFCKKGGAFNWKCSVQTTPTARGLRKIWEREKRESRFCYCEEVSLFCSSESSVCQVRISLTGIGRRKFEMNSADFSPSPGSWELYRVVTPFSCQLDT